MSLTRRQALKSAGAVVVASGLAKPAIAAKDPIPVGYLPALTGPSSSTGVGINRGIQLAVQEINAAGGIDGRQLELITRDTQSDPTKAVNGAAELTRGQKVSVVFGPVNSGESLAVVPLLGAHQHAAGPSLLGRRPDRPAEISDVLSQRAHQPADRRRREPLRDGSAQAQKGRGDQRHHRLRHRVRQRLCADAQGQRRRRRLSGQCRCRQSGPRSPSCCACNRRAPKRSCRGA